MYDSLTCRYLQVAPELVVKIISPGDLWLDVQQKIEDYFEGGVQHLWVVEPEQKTLSVYHSPTDIKKLYVPDTLHGEGTLQGFTLPLAQLFED